MIITRLRSRIPRDIFDYQVIMDALVDYKKPGDKLMKLLQDGAIIRIRKGLYCFHDTLRREPVSREYLANLIYGPSCVSLDFALSYYGFIPEHVPTVTSITLGRSKSFSTPFGIFSYRSHKSNRYSIGITMNRTGSTQYFITSPEKALIDKVWFDKRFSGRSVSGFKEYLFEDLRIDQDSCMKLDLNHIKSIAGLFGAAKITNLYRYLLGVKSDA